MTPPYRILLAEDDAVFREMIAKSLSSLPELEIVGKARDSEELLESIETGQPNMVVLDNKVPGLSGVKAAAKIKQAHAEIKVLLLTVHKSIEHVISALEAKVDGCLLKKNAVEDLVTAIETIRNGRMYLSSLIAQQLVGDSREISQSAPKRSRRLSNRETEVLKHIAEGKSNSEIAAAMRINGPSVRVYIWRIKKKLELKTNDDLAGYAAGNAFASAP